MADDKILITIASLMDCIRAMQRGDELRAKEKLAEADASLMQAADQRQRERLVALF